MKKLLPTVILVLVLGMAVAGIGCSSPGAVEVEISGQQDTALQARSTPANPTAAILARAFANQSAVSASISQDEIAAQWGLGSLSAEMIWNLTMGNPDVLVAVLDTGIDASHPELAGQVVAEANFSNSNTCKDVFGHGTHIAGIIAARLDHQGMAGIAPHVRLLNVKVAEDDGTCSIDNVARGITWSVDNGASVINISIQLAETSPALEEAVEYAAKHEAMIVAAAGNNCPGETIYPACYPSTLAVTAIKPDNQLAPLANIAGWVDFAAPGSQIYSTFPGEEFHFETGTSFATAHMSGFVALMYSLIMDANEKPEIEQVLSLLDICSTDLNLYGYSVGVINLDNLEAIS